MTKVKTGFTLTEVLVAVTIASLGIMALMAIAVYGANYALGVKEQLDARNEALYSEFFLRSMFSQAISVDGADLTPLNEVNVTNTGNITVDRDINNIADTAADGGWANIAVFLREDSTIDSTAIRKTAIWFRSPSATTSGILMIHTDGGEPAQGNGTDLMADGYGFRGIFIQRLTEFEINKLVHNNASGIRRVKEVAIRMVFRYFKRPMIAKTWCPRDDVGVIPACPSNTYFSDLEHSFRVTLRNNDLSNTGADFNMGLGAASIIQRPLGTLHFFKLVVPKTLL